ncbi:MAG TPA: hypothetical protein VI913_03855 [Candidatus Peribacteraceae bacterium]|nr:hypothetical protein [Candidatus Peribacteraceae bacterium]
MSHSEGGPDQIEEVFLRIPQSEEFADDEEVQGLRTDVAHNVDQVIPMTAVSSRTMKPLVA